MPTNYNEAKKILREFGLDYNKIDACSLNCILFTKEYANVDNYIRCGTFRWKNVRCDSNDLIKNSKDKKIPTKVLRHFPIIPRLQRLFMSLKTASHMKWHLQGHSTNGKMRHLVDCLSWKNFDMLHPPTFALESRNVRLALASDGFNPFSNMSFADSTWSVVLIPYNLPPWMCMK